MKKLIITIITTFVSLSSFAIGYECDSIMIQTSEGPVARYLLKYVGSKEWNDTKRFSYMHGALRFLDGVVIKNIQMLETDEGWHLRFNAIDDNTVNFIAYNVYSQDYTTKDDEPFLSFDVIFPDYFSDEDKNVLLKDFTISQGSYDWNNLYPKVVDYYYFGGRTIKISTSKEELKVGDTVSLTANYIPEGSLNNSAWSSDNPNVASIDNQGLLTAISPGKATITVIDWGYDCYATREFVVSDQSIPTTVSGVNIHDNEEKTIYRIDGSQTNKLQRGLNIIKTAESVKKVVK